MERLCGTELCLRLLDPVKRAKEFRTIFQRIAHATGDAHAAEHAMIECLAESLWEAQQVNAAPDEAVYLERLRRLPKAAGL